MSYPGPRYHGAAGETSATYRPADQGPDMTCTGRPAFGEVELG